MADLSMPDEGNTQPKGCRPLHTLGWILTQTILLKFDDNFPVGLLYDVK